MDRLISCYNLRIRTVFEHQKVTTKEHYVKKEKMPDRNFHPHSFVYHIIDLH